MKWLIPIMLVFLFSPHHGMAQGENNIWTFSTAPGGNHEAVNFTPSGPTIISVLPQVNDYQNFAAAVCYPNGQLRFIVRLRPSDWLNEANIYAQNGTPVINSNLLTGMLNEDCRPVIIPKPGNNDQYYIFYTYSKGLLYSLLDMSLNGGNGAIVAGQKDVLLGGYGTIVPSAMTVAKGCNGLWLVIRSRTINAYYSYHVTQDGINPNAIISITGLFPLQEYSLSYKGFLRAAPNSTTLAYIGWRGAELYDFEKCSGKVSNARILDTTGNTPFVSNLTYLQVQNHTLISGIGFSPDNSKLYITENKSDSIITTYLGKLYQYDLTLPTFNDIIASKTLILTNQPSIMGSTTCDVIVNNPLGEIKLAPDGKLYVDNGSYTCRTLLNVPPGFNPGPAFHVINQPNATGLACLPALNEIFLNIQLGSFYDAVDGGHSMLSQNIVLADPVADTMDGSASLITACYSDSVILTASDGACYRWDNGLTGLARTVSEPGTYHVSYYKDCSYTTDTFHVNFASLPNLLNRSESCPGMHMGILIAEKSSGDSSILSFTWNDASGNILQQHERGISDTISGLEAGSYSLTITNEAGCDTTLYGVVNNYPKPQVTTSPADTIIRYGDSIKLNASGAYMYVWWPTASLDTATKANPMARPLQPTLFTVLGLNEFGCRDTGYIHVDIDYAMPDFIPNAFSPNGDGKNDVFRIEGITYQRIIRFGIFNRYGQRIFETTDPAQGWNGSFNNLPCDPGTYYYLVQLGYPDGKTKTFKGDLTLIR